ncbi:MAG: endonuclease III [Chloroflexota bacterium]
MKKPVKPEIEINERRDMPEETLREKQARMARIIERLKPHTPRVRTELRHTTPFELLVATILSAQCTDARVNMITPGLFQKYRSPEEFLASPQEELERDIYSAGFYHAKATNIKKAAQTLIEKFNGVMPGTMEELLTLAGVGRKTANCILGNCFDAPALVVDTHVMRLANRMGFVKSTDADKIEFELQKVVPQEEWTPFAHYMIEHGRKICARVPKCGECVVNDLCPKLDYKKK